MKTLGIALVTLNAVLGQMGCPGLAGAAEITRAVLDENFDSLTNDVWLSELGWGKGSTSPYDSDVRVKEVAVFPRRSRD